jgi:hypothetical protein
VPAARLAAFRGVFYECLTARRNVLFELRDAILCFDGPVTSVAELSLRCSQQANLCDHAKAPG